MNKSKQSHFLKKDYLTKWFSRKNLNGSLVVLLTVITLLWALSAHAQGLDYPYRPAEELVSEAQSISDNLEAYIEDWLAGEVPAEIPKELIPEGIDGRYSDWRLVQFEDIVPKEQWIVREAAPIDLNAVYYLFPDPNCTYIISYGMFAPFGHKVVIEGEYPYSRFFDIQTIGSFEPGVYSTGYVGQAELPIVDVDIPALPGNVNPFKVGANRLAGNRKYKTEFTLAIGDPVVTNPKAQLPPYRDENPERFATGIINTGPLGNEIYREDVPWLIDLILGGANGEWLTSEIWFRYYNIDEGRGPLGGVPLPKMWYETPSGERYFIAYDDTEADEEINFTQPIEKDSGFDDPDDPEVGWTKLYGILRSGLDNLFSNGAISMDEVRNQDLALAGRADDIAGIGSLETSKTLVPYTNYLTRDMSIAEGKVAILTGKMPTFPDTRKGSPTMKPAEVRYWSISTYNTTGVLRVGEALASVRDDEVTIDNERRYVIVYSQPEDRPSNATKENGVTWVRWAPVDNQLWMVRWMSVAPDWEFELTPDENFLPPAKVVETGTQYDVTLIGENHHGGVMGEYLPRVHYLSKEEFEALGDDVSYDNIPIWEQRGGCN